MSTFFAILTLTIAVVMIGIVLFTATRREEYCVVLSACELKEIAQALPDDAVINIIIGGISV